jgi:hypothetical protein
VEVREWSMKSLSITCAAIGLAILATAQQTSTPVNEVHQLYAQDQADRGVGPAKSLPWEQIDPRDRSRRIRVHELLESNQLKTAEDFHDAAFIYQHGHDPEDYLLAHILATVAVQKGDAKSLWISAATLDRYLQSIRQPQVFGTQYNCADKSPCTQAPYNIDLVPNQLRAVFCVPDVEQQRENIKAFDVGKYPDRILPPGCNR